jgi:tungstate transport system permease protein
MELVIQGLAEAVRLLLRGDPEIAQVALRTLMVSGTGTVVAVVVGIPLGAFIAFIRFHGRKAVISFFNLGMGLPPVVVGLWVTILLWRSGPLGQLSLLYTPGAMMIAQGLIASPIVTALTVAALQQVSDALKQQVWALGVTRAQFVWLIMREARYSLMAAVIAGFGAVVSEVGASTMVGGNIKGHTRVLTTATVMEVRKGNFALAIGLSAILLLLAYLVTVGLTLLQQKERRA